MALVLPTAESGPAYQAQAVQDGADLGASVAALGRTGVLNGCQVSWVSGMNVSTTAGVVALAGGVPTTVAAVASLAVAAASTNDRRDIVVWTQGTGVQVVTGVPCSVVGWAAPATSFPPVKPAIPANSVLLGEVYVPGGAAALSAAAITDKTTMLAGDYQWTACGLLNSWVNYGSGYQVAQYRKLSSGLVVVEGLIKNGNGASGVAITQLPAGYRPSGQLLFTSWGGAGACRIDVDVNGNLLSQGNNSASFQSIAGISFFADQ